MHDHAGQFNFENIFSRQFIVIDKVFSRFLFFRKNITLVYPKNQNQL